MNKLFNIHDWQSKQRLNEFEDKNNQFDKETKTIAELANLFLDYSKRLRKGEFKGLDSGEINEIDDLIAMILQGAMDGNIKSILQRFEAMAIKTVDNPDDNLEDELDTEDETI